MPFLFISISFFLESRLSGAALQCCTLDICRDSVRVLDRDQGLAININHHFAELTALSQRKPCPKFGANSPAFSSLFFGHGIPPKTLPRLPSVVERLNF